jgi:hypothetical protein
MQRDHDMPEDAALDATDDALVAKLRALPLEGGEPDWRTLEASIRASVAPLSIPVPWWRNWRWLVPLTTVAATAAIVLVVATQHSRTAPSVAVISHDAGLPKADKGAEPAVAEAKSSNAPAMWLDGEALELDDLDSAADDSLDALEDEAPSELRAVASPEPATVEAVEGAEGSIEAMLPVDGYGWIDSLDDEAAARVERALERKRS